MEGITILSEQIIQDLSIGLFVAVCFIGIVAFIMSTIGLWLEWSDKYASLGSKIGISILVGFFLFIMVVAIIDLVPEMQPYITYQVTIDDTVGFNAFNSQYEIINHSGNIFTVKLREVLP